MRCMIKKILSCVLMVAMLMPMMAAASSADGASQDMKVSEELMDKLGVSQNELKSGDYQLSDNKISCIIWIEDIDMEVPVKAGIEAAERTKPVSLRNMTQPNEAAAYEVMNINGYKLVDVNLEDSADDTYVQAYIATERSVAANMYSQKNASFVEDCLEEQDTAVNYVSNYSPCVFADLSIDEIAELNENENVCRIGYWDDSPCAVEASSDAFTAAERANLNTHINIIRANTARTTYGVTGDGVRIGQIEPGVSQDAIKINSNDSTDSHADRVYTVMHTVAPDAVYYAISSGSGFYSGIESLISNGVNIICNDCI